MKRCKEILCLISFLVGSVSYANSYKNNAFGLGLGWLSQTIKSKVGDSIDVSESGLNIDLSYEHKNFNKGGFYVGSRLSSASYKMKEKNLTNNVELSSATSRFNLDVGYSFIVAPQFFVTPSVGFGSYVIKSKASQSQDFDFIASFSEFGIDLDYRKNRVTLSLMPKLVISNDPEFKSPRTEKITIKSSAVNINIGARLVYDLSQLLALSVQADYQPRTYEDDANDNLELDTFGVVGGLNIKF